MKRQFLFVFLLSTMCLSNTFLLAQAPASGQPTFPDAKKTSGTDLSYKIIEGAGKTFGYDIYSNKKLMIHQAAIPGMPGNEGFKKKESAEKVAQLVVKKIKNGEMPPSVTVEEMKKLKAID